MDFSSDDEHHIHPIPRPCKDQYPTISIPATQKNGRTQEIPMLPGLARLLSEVPVKERRDWVENPVLPDRTIAANSDKFKACAEDIQMFVQRYSNLAIARTRGVTETAVRKWLADPGIQRDRALGTTRQSSPGVRSRNCPLTGNQHATSRSAEQRAPHHGRVIASIGEAAGVIVQSEDKRSGKRTKFASAHDLRRECAQRLINSGVSADPLR